jgi:transcriptional regulator with XRE-family HTH domain
MSTSMTPGRLLREARRAADMTQAELAHQLGSSQPVVARLERPGSNPTWQTLARALRAAGYGVALVPLTPSPAPLDLAQLRERLAMSPRERLRTFQESQQLLEEIRVHARKRDHR